MGSVLLELYAVVQLKGKVAVREGRCFRRSQANTPLSSRLCTFAGFTPYSRHARGQTSWGSVRRVEVDEQELDRSLYKICYCE